MVIFDENNILMTCLAFKISYIYRATWDRSKEIIIVQCTTQYLPPGSEVVVNIIYRQQMQALTKVI